MTHRGSVFFTQTLQIREADLPGKPCLSGFPFNLQFFNPANRLGRIKPFGAGLRAVHNSPAGIELERIFQIIQPVSGMFITAVCNPAIRCQQHCRAKILVPVPPVGGAGRGAAEAQNAFPHTVQLGALFNALLALGIWRRCAV